MSYVPSFPLPTTIDGKDDEWRMVLALADKADIQIAINRGLNLPDDTDVVKQARAVHRTDGRKPEVQAAAYFDAYVDLMAERAAAVTE